MVTVGYNPSTSKIQYQSGTNKQCISCCDFDPNVPSDYTCVQCPANTTPTQMQVTLSGFTNRCSDCVNISGDLRRVGADFDFASMINGTHILPQDPSFPCDYGKIWDPGETLTAREYGACDSGDGGSECSGGFEYEAPVVVIVIAVNKISATEMIMAANAIATSSKWSTIVAGTETFIATTTGTANCFEIDGSWSIRTPLQTNVILEGGSVGIDFS